MTWRAPLIQPKISLHKIPEGYAGTLKTLDHIRGLIKQGAKDFRVRQAAIDILMRQGVRPKDYAGEIKAIFEWVQRNIRYTRDTFRVEVLHSARRMLQLRAGDCDDLSILLGSMLEAIGHPVRLVLTGPNALRPDHFTHIYVEAFQKGRWIPLDATMPHAMGWAPPTPIRKVVTIERSPDMMAENIDLQGYGAPAAVPEWLSGLIRSVRNEAIKPKDGRVKSLWSLLRQRELLNRNLWLKTVLRRIWTEGLPARPRPRTTQRLIDQLRLWDILPRPAARAVRPLKPVALRPVAARPVRPARTQR